MYKIPHDNGQSRHKTEHWRKTLITIKNNYSNRSPCRRDALVGFLSCVWLQRHVKQGVLVVQLTGCFDHRRSWSLPLSASLTLTKSTASPGLQGREFSHPVFIVIAFFYYTIKRTSHTRHDVERIIPKILRLSKFWACMRAKLMDSYCWIGPCCARNSRRGRQDSMDEYPACLMMGVFQMLISTRKQSRQRVECEIPRNRRYYTFYGDPRSLVECVLMQKSLGMQPIVITSSCSPKQGWAHD